MKSYVQVGVRIRPPIPKEIQAQEYKKCLALKNNDGETGKDSKIFISLSGKPLMINADNAVDGDDVHIYNFKKIFDTNSTQDDVYQTMVRPAIDSVVNKGINACIFAYG